MIASHIVSVIDASEGWFSVTDDAEVDQSDLVAAVREQSEAADAILLGRVTFEEMRGYWPRQTDDTTGVSDYLNRVTKHVVSSTMGDPEWEHTIVLPGDGFLNQVRALKSKPGKDIVTTGSISLVHALIPAGLVDEYRLFLYPVVLGRGRRLFADPTEIRTLQLVETRPFRSGIVLLRYGPT